MYEITYINLEENKTYEKTVERYYINVLKKKDY